MKPRAVSVTECEWTTEECPLVDAVAVAAQRDSLCLPNLFRSKRVKPFNQARTGPTSQVHYTARELLLELLDRGGVEELSRKASSIKAAGTSRPSHSQSRERADLTEEQYSEFLTWITIILQNGLSSGEHSQRSASASAFVPPLDRWQGALKRSSFHTSLLFLSRLEDEDKMEVLSALLTNLASRSQALYTPGQHLAVKKYTISVRGHSQPSCPLNLALLCDLSSGFVCNIYLYCPEVLQRSSRTSVVEQVLGQLLKPFFCRGHQVQLDSSAWVDGGLTQLFSDLGVNLHFVAPLEKSETEEMVLGEASSPSPPPYRTQEDSAPLLTAHLQGWTGPALLSKSDVKGASPDVFLPGFWVTVHLACINAFVLHSLQYQEAGQGRRISLREFSRALVSQLAMESCVAVPTMSTNNSSSRVIPMEEGGCSSGWGVQRVLVGRLPGVCGLANCGNSCYMNAVLQCLCSTVPLVEHLLSPQTRNELAKRETVVAGVFVHLLEEVWLGQSYSCTPGEVRSMVCSLHPQFDNYSQQDAQELLLFLLNALHDDLKKKGERRQTRSSSRHGRKSPGGSGESTIVTGLFEGQLSYVTLCMRCDHQAHSNQVFTMLSLPIPSEAFKCSLQDCLSLFFQQSTLTRGDQMLCPECGVRRDTTVLTSMAKPPEILVLHLKRFGCHGSNKKKLRTNVLFSLENLDLTPFLSNPSAQHISYSLYAVVNHTGDLDMGHFTALCYSALSCSWHHFDDTVVSKVQDYLIQSPNAYMLLYSRQPFHRPIVPGI